MVETLTEKIKNLSKSTRFEKGITLFNGVTGTIAGLSGIAYSIYQAFNGESGDAFVTELSQLMS